jgi:hypothetical protein
MGQEMTYCSVTPSEGPVRVIYVEEGGGA